MRCSGRRESSRRLQELQAGLKGSIGKRRADCAPPLIASVRCLRSMKACLAIVIRELSVRVYLICLQQPWFYARHEGDDWAATVSAGSSLRLIQPHISTWPCQRPH